MDKIFNKFGFFSLGLIGGSIAMAIKKAYPDCEIVAYARRQATLDEAFDLGIIDKGTTDKCDTVFADCDLIFLCAPVDINNQFLTGLKGIVSNKTIITDVGSVKGAIHKVVSSLGLDGQFIGGHPMAGSEKTGIANADPEILRGAYYIITPTDKVGKEAVDAYYSLIEDMGAIPVVLDDKAHDYATAAVSHVPHLASAALANLVHDNDDENGTMKLIAASGFKDTTRIAASSADMWEAISMSNNENIADLLDKYIASLQEISSAVRDGRTGYVHELFEKSKEYRETFT
jgi:prephenate dehydrogenase